MKTPVARHALRSLRALGLAGAALSRVAEGGAETPSAPPSFAGEAERVLVDVVVLGPDGAPVPGLRAEEFQVFEDGERQDLESFEPVVVTAGSGQKAQPERVSTNARSEVRAGRTFVLVFDEPHLSAAGAEAARRAIAAFVEKAVHDGDSVTLLAPPRGDAWSARMPEGRADLLALLSRLRGRRDVDLGPEAMSDSEAFEISQRDSPSGSEDAELQSPNPDEDRRPTLGTRDLVYRRWVGSGACASPPASVGAGSQASAENVASALQAARLRVSRPCYARIAARANEVYQRSRQRQRSTLDALERTLDGLALRAGRKAILLLSEGFIHDPHQDALATVAARARVSNAAFYFVDVRGLIGLAPSGQAAQRSVARTQQNMAMAESRDRMVQSAMERLTEAAGADALALETGGRSIRSTNDIAGGMQAIADESRVYYLLGYHPSKPASDGRFRRIDVRLRRKGLTVRARKGYRALAPATAGEPARQAVDPALAAALASPYEHGEIPLRLTAFVFEETAEGRARVVVTADVDAGSLRAAPGEAGAGPVAVVFAISHREAPEASRMQVTAFDLEPAAAVRWRPLAATFELPPGVVQAKVGVRDRRGRMGTVAHRFEVPSLGRWRVSTPVLTDTVQEEAGAPARPVLAARREFANGGWLFCSYEVYGAGRDAATHGPRVSGSYVILNDARRVVRIGEAQRIEPTPDGLLFLSVGIPLATLPPGEHELVLSVVDDVSKERQELREPFRVLPAAAGS